MKVRAVLSQKGRHVHTMAADRPITEAIRRFVDANIRSVVITDEGRVVGVLTIRDLLRRLVERGEAALQERVAESMSSDIETVTPETDVEDVESLFDRRHINHVPVVDDGDLAGVLTPADVFAEHMREVRDANDRLLSYISGEYY